ncbi:MAG: 3-hydroxyacyl-CoA dehydrogenase NAD-binding domain-containing protein [Thermincola sp.]|nr:3-hydroxyacyl-CoA dehydrogenase NAD-binding domain-containing protein [Thermincola sp.]MDT3704981.1 3-hydroxyacyl-CoA dehydrogenase NAD-binding domain-containing protein [Thermincola sp.]
MKIKTVVVLGSGTMGNGITQVIAQAGYEVYMRDVSQELLDRGMAVIKKSLSKFVEKGKITADAEKEILGRITPTTEFDEVVKKADLIIEAVPENIELKTKIFSELEEKCPPETLFASNTSSLPITALAAVTKRPERFLGTHFMSPVPMMGGVELVRGRMTSDETLEEIKQFIISLGKTPTVAVDYAGFVTSRLLDLYLNEAAYAVMDGNDPKEVDAGMVHCTNMPMGPCALTDMVGADVLLFVLEILEKEFGEKFRPAPLLRQMVRAGHLGRKTGRGYYIYK